MYIEESLVDLRSKESDSESFNSDSDVITHAMTDAVVYPYLSGQSMRADLSIEQAIIKHNADPFGIEQLAN